MEARKDIKIDNEKSSLYLENRNKLKLTGVIEVVNFNDEEISLTTKLGKLSIKGSDLKMNKLDVQNGELMIAGNIDSCIYSKNITNKNESMLAKLFK